MEGSLYRLIDPPASSSMLGCWEEPVGSFTEVVGYSHLGSLFLRDPTTQKYVVVHPLADGDNARGYGAFVDVAAFTADLLADAAFVEESLRPADVAALELRLGPLGDEEVYIPVPYPCLGGSGALSTFEKGNVWVFVDLVGQTLGLE